MSFLFFGLAALWSAAMVYHFIDLLRFFQLEEYNPGRFMAWGLQKWQRVLLLPELAAAVIILVLAALQSSVNSYLAGSAAVIALGLGAWMVRRANRVQIKPLVYTARAKRLLGMGIFVILAAGAAVSLSLLPGMAQSEAALVLGFIGLMLLAQFVWAAGRPFAARERPGAGI